MLPRRLVLALNSLSKKPRTRLNGSRNLSTNRKANCSTVNLNRIPNKISVLSPNGNDHCYVCHDAVPVRYLKTDIIRSDNVVISPYQDVDVPDCLLHEIIWQYLDRFPDYTAIECALTGRKYTYTQLREHCRQFAAALLKSGLKPGQVIALVLPNIPEFPIALYGASEAGIIVSTVNPGYTADEICNQLKDSNSVAVVTFADKLNVVLQAKAKLEEQTKGSQKLKIISVQDYDGISRPCPDGVWLFKEMLENNLDTAVLNSISVEYNIKPDNNVILPYSSGTTGLPKGVCLTHHNIVSNIRQMEEKETEHIMFPQENFQDVLPGVLPFFHIYGLNIILSQALRHGAKIVTLTKFDAESFLKILKEHKNSVVYIVPPIVLFLGMHPAITKELLENVRFTVSGAAPIGASDIERCLTKMPDTTSFIQGYGMTESSPLTLIPPNKRCNNFATIGKPVSLTKAKIVDENGKILGAGENGELCLQGPQVMKCYLNRPEATAETIDKEGWLHTGDIGFYDKAGDFYIVDRKKELIKVKGFQVAPAELEELLRNHPQVADVAVIGIPDARSGEVPIAYVVPRQGQEHLKAENVQSFVADKVTDYKQLSQVILTKSIPKSASGKILRRELKNLYLSADK